MNEIYEWAKKYHKVGWSIFPVGKDKKPLENWKKYQSEKADLEQIKKWFDVPNPPNIGIATGKISNITVVDVEKGGEWKDLPITLTVKTGGGGVHLYYRYAEGVGNSVRIRELTDIRGDGGYVVAAPSIHQSGEKYEFIRKEPEQPFPFQMFNLKPKHHTDWNEVVKGIESGERNMSAAKFIGKMLQTFPPSQWNAVWEITVDWNLKNKPPLSEYELRNTFNSITGTAKRTGNYKQEDNDEDCDIKLLSEVAKDITDDISLSYPTGYKVYDEAFMGGLKEGDLVVISGYKGLGKTLLAKSMTYNLVKQSQPCMWFSFEVPAGELWRKFKDMGVDDDFMTYVPEKTVNRKMDWVTEKIIEARDRFKTKIVFIDHLGFMAEDPSNYDSNLTTNQATKLTMICRRLKSIAIQENVAIVLLAHLKKPAHGSSDPTVHDLKDSSGVAQEADSVLLINRKRKSGSYSDEDDVYEPQSYIKIDKNRRTGQSKRFVVEMVGGKLVDSEGAAMSKIDEDFNSF